MIWLKKYLEDWLSTEVEVTKTKGNFGDYTTNLVMKKLADKEETLSYLNEHPLIEAATFKNGYINVSIKTAPLNLKGPLGQHPRMSTLHNLLKKEDHTTGELPEHFYDLAKLTNELNHCLDQAYDFKKIHQDILKTFKRLDLGYVYRAQSDTALGGIYQLLHDILIVLGRINE